MPFDHKGRWQKKYDSLMNPGDKVTWPQLMAEFVVYWRTRYYDKYNSVKKGKDWWHPIAKDIKGLVQQTHVLCNYFPHPDDEPLVINAVKTFLRENRTTKIGQFRKTRASICDDEKSVVIGIKYHLNELLEKRQVFDNAKPTDTMKKVEDIKYKRIVAPTGLNKLIDLENKLTEKKD